MSSRSGAPGRKGRRASENPVNRPSSLRAIPRARKTDNRVRSATEARDIEAWAPLMRACHAPRGRTIPKRYPHAKQRARSGALDPPGKKAVEPPLLGVEIR